MSVFNKPFIFVSGAPRSGTSLITKIIDAHPDVALVKENIFDNRRRHWRMAEYRNDMNLLKKKITDFYENFNEPIIGNKVCTPDVWFLNDILRFCSFFKNCKIIFVVRDPRAVVISRYNRAVYSREFNMQARQKFPFDFQQRTATYLKLWKDSISVYHSLKKKYQNHIQIIYYDDFCKNPDVKSIFNFLEINYHPDIDKWHLKPHYNAKGELIKDLKYSDNKISYTSINSDDLPSDFSLKDIGPEFKAFQKRTL